MLALVNTVFIPSGPPTIIFNSNVVNRIKSLPSVQQVIPQYQGQLQLNAMGNIENAQVMGMDPTKLVVISPSLQMVRGSTVQQNNPTGMLVGDNIANGSNCVNEGITHLLMIPLVLLSQPDCLTFGRSGYLLIIGRPHFAYSHSGPGSQFTCLFCLTSKATAV